MRRLALAIPLSFVVAAACTAVAPAVLAPASPSPLPSATALALPRPIPQPITRTSPAAQVAWLSLQIDRGGGQFGGELVAVDPSGAVVATLDRTALGANGWARSSDGASLLLFEEDRIDIRSALDGSPQRTYRAAGARVIDSASSGDARWLALLLPASQLQLLDLKTGLSQSFALGHDPNAAVPGTSGSTSTVLWESLAFAPDSAHLYVISDWGGPARLTGFALTGETWALQMTAVDRQGSVRYPSCAGPAMAVKVVQGGRVLAAFCHVDGAVWLFDLPTPTSATVLRPRQDNPFWLSPIFTPDGQLLYLHQWPGFGDQMQVVDLASRRLAGPAATPTKLGQTGPFAWLAPLAYAGGTASTVPVSPDGLRLYSATGDGVVVLRIPDLTPIAKLANGLATDEVWISGDGRTVYATAGAKLVVARDDGAGARTVDLRGRGSFVASERG